MQAMRVLLGVLQATFSGIAGSVPCISSMKLGGTLVSGHTSAITVSASGLKK